MNKWGIPAWLEDEVLARDKTCVYCGIEMLDKKPPNGSRRSVATWEHIINDASIVTRENIARCCFSCNSSKGTKKLSDWMQSNYCRKRGINKDTVAGIAKQALKTEGKADPPNNAFAAARKNPHPGESKAGKGEI